MGLDDNAAVLLNVGGLALEVLLALLDWDGSVLARAGVDLKTTLVGLKAHLNTSAWAGHAEDLNSWVVNGDTTWTVVDESIVIADATSATAVLQLEGILANCLWLGEVVEATLCEADLTSWDLDTVNINDTVSQWHVEGVVQDELSVLVDKGTQVPVDVVGEHDWGWASDWDGDHAAGPGSIVAQSVGGNVEDIAWEAGLSLIVEAESDAVGSHSGDSPVLLIIADEATVEGVLALVLVGGNVAGHAVNGEGTVLDAEKIVSRCIQAIGGDIVKNYRLAYRPTTGPK